MEIWTVWHGTYRLAGIVKAVTAAASLATAALLVPLVPRALTLPSHAQLEAANPLWRRQADARTGSGMRA